MKPKIITDREPVSSSEILARKNFKQLSAQANLMSKPFYQSTWFISSAALATLAIITTLILITPAKETNTDNNTTIAQNDNLASQKNVALTHYDEDSPCISPPVKGAEKPFSIYTIDAQKGGRFSHPTGSEVIIPSNAFTDENGKPVSGEIEIRYREFHDQVDVLLSGIPMQYDSAGTKYQFESAGMVDIHGYQNGKPVTLQKDKKITIALASRYPGTQYNVYSLDTNARNWVYEGKDKVTEIQKTGNSSTADPVVNSAENIDFSAMKNDPEIKKLNAELVIIQNEIIQIKKEKPVPPKELDNSKYNFNIDVEPRDFPEFSAFNDTRFEVGPENKNFTADLYKITWEDAILNENVKGISYKLTLVKGKDRKTFIVYPVFQGATLEKAKSLYEEKFNTYSNKLTQKQEEEKLKAAELKKEEERWKAEAKKVAEERRLELSRQEKLRQENQITTTASLNQYGLVLVNGQVQNVKGVMFTSNAAIVQRTFNIDGFGTYNCDSPQQWPHGANISADFVSSTDNKRIPANQVYLVIKDRNLYFNYNDENWFNFKFNPRSNNMIVAPLRNGHVAAVGNEAFAALDKNQSYGIFHLTVSEKPITSEGEFREFLMQI